MVTGFKQWHFLCIQWNGIAGTVNYFYDGYAVDSKIQNEKLKTQLPPGKNFSIGLGDGTGKLTQLNIWDYEIATGSVIAMSSGGFNVHGSVMSWSSLQAKYIPGASINWNSEIHLPGKSEDLNKSMVLWISPCCQQNSQLTGATLRPALGKMEYVVAKTL